MAKLHQWTLKDNHSEAYEVECAVCEALAQRELEAGELKSMVAGMLEKEIAGEVFDSVLYGMRKEGIVAFVGGKVSLMNSSAPGV